MATDPRPPTLFSAIYRNPRVGDIIIRTVDEVDFHVYKAILSAASPFFAHMFTLPQPSSHPTNASEKPLLTVAETATVWEMLITLCYAPRAPGVDDFADIDALRAVLDASEKYQMNVAIEFGRRALLLPKFVETTPFVVYALGYAYKFPDVIRAAAKQTLRFSIYFDYCDMLDTLTLRGYHRLSAYRKECGAVAKYVVDVLGRDWSRPSYLRVKQIDNCVFTLQDICTQKHPSPGSLTLPCFSGGHPYNHISGYGPIEELRKYLHVLCTQLEYLPDANLARSKLFLQNIIDLALRDGCRSCSQHIHKYIARFSEALYGVIEDAISQVVLEIDGMELDE
ncbi:hypothetical protein C2E23DRAFT_889496 [Lenzites betulinus]|nr:hypothetical protein C2E23DRAFT_889496 [Lenzites betulinus]